MFASAAALKREAAEKALLQAELRLAEAVTISVVAASFELGEGELLGIHLNEANVILHMDEGGLGERDGSRLEKDVRATSRVVGLACAFATRACQQDFRRRRDVSRYLPEPLQQSGIFTGPCRASEASDLPR